MYAIEHFIDWYSYNLYNIKIKPSFVQNDAILKFCDVNLS